MIVFRTVTAMLIPIALAITALVTAFLLPYILAGLTDINTITPILVSMIGLGAGSYYSVFKAEPATDVCCGLVSRIRDENAVILSSDGVNHGRLQAPRG
jgi:MMPL family